MARRACAFKQYDVTRIVKAVVATGHKVQRVEVDTAGKIVVVVDLAGADGCGALPLDEWIASHARAS